MMVQGCDTVRQEKRNRADAVVYVAPDALKTGGRLNIARKKRAQTAKADASSLQATEAFEDGLHAYKGYHTSGIVFESAQLAPQTTTRVPEPPPAKA